MTTRQRKAAEKKEALAFEAKVIANAGYWGMSLDEARAEMLKDIRQEKETAARLKFNELRERDTSDFHAACDSAACNAESFCHENGFAQDEMEFWECAVDTLEMILESPEDWNITLK